MVKPRIIAALETQLVASKIATTNNALYETILGLIRNLTTTVAQVNVNIATLNAIAKAASSSTSGLTHVPMVTGAIPIQIMSIGPNVLLIGFRP